MKMCACAAFMEPSLLQSATIRHIRPTLWTHSSCFLWLKKNRHCSLVYLIKKNFYIRPKITLNSHLTQNYIRTRLHHMRPNLRAGAVFTWPWQSAPNITRASGYLLNQTVFFVFLLVLTSLLFKKPFHVQFKPSRVFKTTMHCVQRRFKRPLITSRQSTQSYASRERNLLGKSLKSSASRVVLVKSETPVT